MKDDDIRNTQLTATLADQMRRGDLFSERCPSRDVLKHITSRWGVLILVALLAGTHRFSELRRKVGGVSERMLAQTLQWLEGDGLVLRISYPVVPPHVEYSLTPLGRIAGVKVEALADWIEENLSQIVGSQRRAAENASSAAQEPVHADGDGTTIAGARLRQTADK